MNDESELWFIGLCFCWPSWLTRIACWYSARLVIKGLVSLNPGKSGMRSFISRINFLCWLFFGVLSNPCYCSGTLKTQVIQLKVQVAGYTKTHIHPWPNKVGVGWLCCPGIEWEPVRDDKLTHNLSRNTWSQSSQLGEPKWTDPGQKSWIGVHKRSPL